MRKPHKIRWRYGFSISIPTLFVGSTCISYGSVTTPLIGADLLGITSGGYVQDGISTGEALMRAKIELVREMNKRQGYLDGEDQKTLISFVHYGDPFMCKDSDEPLKKVICPQHGKSRGDTSLRPE